MDNGSPVQLLGIVWNRSIKFILNCCCCYTVWSSFQPMSAFSRLSILHTTIIWACAFFTLSSPYWTIRRLIFTGTVVTMWSKYHLIKVYKKQNFRYSGYYFIRKNSQNYRSSDWHFFHISFCSRNIKYSNKTPLMSQYVHSKFTYRKLACIFKITEWNHLKPCMWIHVILYQPTVLENIRKNKLRK